MSVERALPLYEKFKSAKRVLNIALHDTSLVMSSKFYSTTLFSFPADAMKVAD